MNISALEKRNTNLSRDMEKKMALKRPNCKVVRMSGNCEVFDNTDLLEDILVRVPHESIFNCIVVSKRWFGLISDSSFLEHYIKRWSDEVNFVDPKPCAEGDELQRLLQSPQLAALDQLQHRLQSQQLAALDQLQLRVPLHYRADTLRHFVESNKSLHELHPKRVVALNELQHKLQLAAENQCDETVVHEMMCDAEIAHVGLMFVNKSQQDLQSRVMDDLRWLVKALPSQLWAAVNDVQHLIVCRLLVVVNEAQHQQYFNFMSKPLKRSAEYMAQQWISKYRDGYPTPIGLQGYPTLGMHDHPYLQGAGTLGMHDHPYLQGAGTLGMHDHPYLQGAGALGMHDHPYLQGAGTLGMHDHPYLQGAGTLGMYDHPYFQGAGTQAPERYMYLEI